MPKKRLNFGVVDPITIIGVLFLIITLSIGTYVIADKKYNFNIFEKAAILECFPAGTKITTEGGTKSIEDFVVGDKVLSEDVESGKKETSNTTKLWKLWSLNMCSVEFEDHDILKLTNPHPLYTKEGWKAINVEEALKHNPKLSITQLTTNDFVKKEDGSYSKITDISCKYGLFRVYNLAVDTNNNYFAQKYLVHNKKTSVVDKAGTTTVLDNGGKVIKQTQVDEDTGEVVDITDQLPDQVISNESVSKITDQTTTANNNTTIIANDCRDQNGTQLSEGDVVVGGTSGYSKCTNVNGALRWQECPTTECNIKTLTVVPSYLAPQRCEANGRTWIDNNCKQPEINTSVSENAATSNYTQQEITEITDKLKENCRIRDGIYNSTTNTCSADNIIPTVNKPAVVTQTSTQTNNNWVETLKNTPGYENYGRTYTLEQLGSNDTLENPKYSSRDECMAAENNNYYICNKYDAIASLYEGLNTLSSSKFGNYVQSYQNAQGTMSQSEAKAAVEKCIANGGSPFGCTTQATSLYQFATNEQLATSTKLGTDIVGKIATIYGSTEVLTAKSLAEALGIVFNQMSTINTAASTLNNMTDCLDGDTNCARGLTQTAINWAFLGSTDYLNNAIKSANPILTTRGYFYNAGAISAQGVVNIMNTSEACSDGGVDCALNIAGDALLAFGISQNVRSIDQMYTSWLKSQVIVGEVIDDIPQATNLLTSTNNISQNLVANNVVEGNILTAPNPTGDMAITLIPNTRPLVFSTNNFTNLFQPIISNVGELIPTNTQSSLSFNPPFMTQTDIANELAMQLENGKGLPPLPVGAPPINEALSRYESGPTLINFSEDSRQIINYAATVHSAQAPNPVRVIPEAQNILKPVEKSVSSLAEEVVGKNYTLPLGRDGVSISGQPVKNHLGVSLFDHNITLEANRPVQVDTHTQIVWDGEKDQILIKENKPTLNELAFGYELKSDNLHGEPTGKIIIIRPGDTLQSANPLLPESGMQTRYLPQTYYQTQDLGQVYMRYQDSNGQFVVIPFQEINILPNVRGYISFGFMSLGEFVPIDHTYAVDLNEITPTINTIKTETEAYLIHNEKPIWLKVAENIQMKVPTLDIQNWWESLKNSDNKIIKLFTKPDERGSLGIPLPQQENKTTIIPIGRTSQQNFFTDMASGKHGQIELSIDGKIKYTDVGSTNGSFYRNGPGEEFRTVNQGESIIVTPRTEIKMGNDNFVKVVNDRGNIKLVNTSTPSKQITISKPTNISWASIKVGEAITLRPGDFVGYGEIHNQVPVITNGQTLYWKAGFDDNYHLYDPNQGLTIIKNSNIDTINIHFYDEAGSLYNRGEALVLTESTNGQDGITSTITRTDPDGRPPINDGLVKNWLGSNTDIAKRVNLDQTFEEIPSNNIHPNRANQSIINNEPSQPKQINIYNPVYYEFSHDNQLVSVGNGDKYRVYITDDITTGGEGKIELGAIENTTTGNNIEVIIKHALSPEDGQKMVNQYNLFDKIKNILDAEGRPDLKWRIVTPLGIIQDANGNPTGYIRSYVSGKPIWEMGNGNVNGKMTPDDISDFEDIFKILDNHDISPYDISPQNFIGQPGKYVITDLTPEENIAPRKDGSRDNLGHIVDLQVVDTKYIQKRLQEGEEIIPIPGQSKFFYDTHSSESALENFDRMVDYQNNMYSKHKPILQSGQVFRPLLMGLSVTAAGLYYIDKYFDLGLFDNVKNALSENTIAKSIGAAVNSGYFPILKPLEPILPLPNASFENINYNPTLIDQPKTPTETKTKPDGLTSYGKGECTRNGNDYCDGERMYDLYLWYKNQSDGWWQDGDFTPADFLAMMLVAESTGGDTEFLKSIMVATANQLWGSSDKHRPYCTTPDCEAGIFNFLGDYVQSAGERYNGLISNENNPSQGTLKNLASGQEVADYFAKNGLSINQIANDVIYDPISKEYNNDVPTQWGVTGCGQNCEGIEINWLKNLNNTSGVEYNTTDRCGIYDSYGLGNVQAVVYTNNQMYNWSLKDSPCLNK